MTDQTKRKPPALPRRPQALTRSMYCGCRRLLRRAKRLESNGYDFRLFNTEIITHHHIIDRTPVQCPFRLPYQNARPYTPSLLSVYRALFCPQSEGGQFLRACLISQRVRIGEIGFLSCKAKSRSNPDGLQGFLTQSGRKTCRQGGRGEMLNRLLYVIHRC